MSTFNFGLVLVLNVDLISGFYPQYLAFLQALAEALSSANTNLVTMIVLKQGSTNVTSNLTTLAESNSAEST